MSDYKLVLKNTNNHYRNIGNRRARPQAELELDEGKEEQGCRLTSRVYFPGYKCKRGINRSYIDIVQNCINNGILQGWDYFVCGGGRGSEAEGIQM